eukprot:GHVU01092957.1.p1 GENE.GHVU01092957.1~~GHVU01092957.1.p1  ORF type:complete len:386 (-),score=36.16 GHVU01092957.1:462-1493(-)
MTPNNMTVESKEASSMCRQLQCRLFAAALVPFAAGTSQDLRLVPDPDWPSAVEWRPSWHALRADCSSMATKLQSLYAGDPVANISRYSPIEYQIQLHNPKIEFISGSIIQYGGWESGKIQAIRDHFSDFPNAIFVDVGCNIGTISTAIKALLPQVPIFSFEPKRDNAARFCRTVTLKSNKFDLNNLYFFPYGLGNETNVNGDFSMLTMTPNNQGALQVRPAKHSSNRPADPTDPHSSAIGILQFDDLLFDVIQPRFPNRGHPVIMKIDIEGYECEAFEGMRSFFEYYSLKYIVMEWYFVRDTCGRQILDLMHSMGLVPASEDGVLLTGDPQTWPDDIMFRMRK